MPTGDLKDFVFIKKERVKIQVIAPKVQYLEQLKRYWRRLTIDKNLKPIVQDSQSDNNSTKNQTL